MFFRVQYPIHFLKFGVFRLPRLNVRTQRQVLISEGVVRKFPNRD